MPPLPLQTLLLFSIITYSPTHIIFQAPFIWMTLAVGLNILTVTVVVVTDATLITNFPISPKGEGVDNSCPIEAAGAELNNERGKDIV